GFSGGRAAACLTSCFGAVVFGADVSGRAAVCLASITFGFAGGVLAVASPPPPIPTLRARLENHPSLFSAAGAALATRVGAAAGVGAGAAASFGGSGVPISRLSEGALGGLTWEGMGAGARSISDHEPCAGSEKHAPA